MARRAKTTSKKTVPRSRTAIKRPPVNGKPSPPDPKHLTGTAEGDHLFDLALAAMNAASHGVGGVFSVESARGFVRAVRAIRSEVMKPTAEPKPSTAKREGSGDSEDGSHGPVDPWLDDELTV